MAGSGRDEHDLLPGWPRRVREGSEVTPDCTYTYNSSEVTINGPEGRKIKCTILSRNRFEIRGASGEPSIFSRRGT